MRVILASGFNFYKLKRVGLNLLKLSFCNSLTTMNCPNLFNSNSADSTSIDLVWEDLSNSEEGYILERSTNGINYSVVETFVADTIIFTDTGLSPDTIYYYRLRAYKGNVYTSYAYTSEITTMESVPNLILHYPLNDSTAEVAN